VTLLDHTINEMTNWLQCRMFSNSKNIIKL